MKQSNKYKDAITYINGIFDGMIVMGFVYTLFYTNSILEFMNIDLF